MLDLKIYKFHMEGNMWNQPTIRHIYKAIKIAYNPDFYLNYGPIEEFADAIESEIRLHPVLYDDVLNTWHWWENMQIATYRASSLNDVESLFKFRQDYYGSYIYVIWTCFEAHPALCDVIGVEILIMPPLNAHWDSDTDEDLSNNAPTASSHIEE